MHFISLGKLFQSIGASAGKLSSHLRSSWRDGDKEGARLPLISLYDYS